jgi:hypothetical protein
MSLTVCSLANAAVETGFCAYQLPIDAGRPRTVLAVGKTDLLALDRDAKSVVFLYDSDNDGLPDSRRIMPTSKFPKDVENDVAFASFQKSKAVSNPNPWIKLSWNFKPCWTLERLKLL